jgi:hypothetical protein
MDNAAVAALVIAPIALITAIGQLIQAYLGTADGYRMCQSSVMGKKDTITLAMGPIPLRNSLH